jgi:hypothetical protein
VSMLGVPIGSEREPGDALRAFDHVPRLHELLPNGGWPGVMYAQVCVHNVANAALRTEVPANLRAIRGTVNYEIVGPRGSAQMALVGTGKPIPATPPECGARLFFTDGEVERLTGHPVKEYVIWLRPQPEEPAPTKPKPPSPAAKAE